MHGQVPQIAEQPIAKLNAIRIIIVMMIAMGYASTMPFGESNAAGIPNPEFLAHLGYDPSWIGISLLFLLSGFLGMRSLTRHGSAKRYLSSRLFRNAPLLVFVTLFVILVIYPIFGEGRGSPGETLRTILFYFVGTVTCIKPGEPLPGLLDHAQYECLIQGAIWTLKWGVLAHIAMALGQRFDLLANRRFVITVTLLSILFYIVINYIYLNEIAPVPGDIILASQLGWPFLVGVSLFQYWEKVSSRLAVNLMITAGFFAIALFLSWTAFVPWSKAIIVTLTMAWAWVCVSLLKLEDHQFTALNNWPPLALALYLVNWPVAQIILLSFPGLDWNVFMVVTLTTTVILAWGAHKLVSEKSFRYAQKRSFSILQA